MLAVAYESSGQPLPQVSKEGHSRSSPVWFEACKHAWTLGWVTGMASIHAQNVPQIFF